MEAMLRRKSELLLQVVNDLEQIEDFIKVNAFDRIKRELNSRDCDELLRMIRDVKTKALE